MPPSKQGTHVARRGGGRANCPWARTRHRLPASPPSPPARAPPQGINALHELPPAVAASVLRCIHAAISWMRATVGIFAVPMVGSTTTTQALG